MKTGVVLEVNKNYLLLLTADGEFCRVKRPKTEVFVGSEVTLPEINKKKSSIRQILAAAAVLLMVLIPTLVIAPALTAGYTVVQIDINPSIEMLLDEDSKVISAVGLNNDGRHLIQNLSLYGKKSSLALQEIIKAAKDDGFIDESNQDNAIIIALSPEGDDSEAWRQNTADLQLELEEAAQNETAGSGCEVIAVMSDAQFRDNARIQGLSIGKMFIVMAAEEEGIEITPSELTNSRLTDVIRNKGANAREVLERVRNNIPSGEVYCQDSEGKNGSKEIGDGNKGSAGNEDNEQNGGNKSNSTQDTGPGRTDEVINENGQREAGSGFDTDMEDKPVGNESVKPPNRSAPGEGNKEDDKDPPAN